MQKIIINLHSINTTVNMSIWEILTLLYIANKKNMDPMDILHKHINAGELRDYLFKESINEN